MKPASLLVFLLIFTCNTKILAADSIKILVIESYHSEYQWDKNYTRAIRDTLEDKVELSFFQMDTKRLPLSEHKARSDLAWQRYQELQPALVILGDDNALLHLGKRFGTTDTPVIYLGINNNPRNYFSVLPKNITGILERPLLHRSIIYMRNILGEDLKKVLILFDHGTTSKTILQEEFKGRSQRFIGPIDVHIELIDNLDRWHYKINNAKKEGFNAIVVGLYHTLRNQQGDHVPAPQVITWSSNNTQIPLFAFWQFAVGADKTTGGLTLDAYNQGQLAAEMAMKILDGELQLPQIPQSSGQGRLVFSESQLRRWQIELPERIRNQAQILP
ncbi:MAG: hypothetical protein OQK12_03055 [Motiliproteus sp.]|nr:hypothetical protein [Motiliproteus sp.]MCW9053695.1 hypothetical protein [Motiliproteus sp.]